MSVRAWEEETPEYRAHQLRLDAWRRKGQRFGRAVILTFIVGAVAGFAGAMLGIGTAEMERENRPLVQRTALPPAELARSLREWMAKCEGERLWCRDGSHGAACDFNRDRCYASWREKP